jgi:hypothetical protein
MSTRDIFWGLKVAGAYGRQLATLRASTGLYRVSFTCLSSRFYECVKEKCEVSRRFSYDANRSPSRRTRVQCREAADLNCSHCLVREVKYCDVPRLGKAADRNVLRDLHFAWNVQTAIWRLPRTVCTC